MNAILKKIDIFSLQIPLPYKGEKKFSTNIGLFFTFLYLTIISLSLFYFSSEKIKNPYVQVHNQLASNDLKINLNDYNLFFAMGVYSNHLMDEFIQESIFNVKANYYIYNRITSNHTKKEIKIVKCDLNYVPDGKTFLTNNMKKLICFDNEVFQDLILNGFVESDFYQGIEISFFRCENTTNSSNCASQEKIDQYLNSGWFNFYTFDTNVDPYNKDPLILTQRGNYGYFGKYSLRHYLINYCLNEFVKDEGLIFPSNKTFKYGEIFSITNENHYRTDNQFIYILLELSKSKKSTIISYEKLPKILGQIGGMLEIFYVVLKTILQPLIEIVFYRELINQNFYYIDSKRPTKEILPRPNKIKKFFKKIYLWIKQIKFKQKEEDKRNHRIKLHFKPKTKHFNEKKANPKKNLVKFETNLLELIKINFKKKLNLRENLLKKSVLDISKKIEYDFVIKKFRELDIMKNLVLEKENIEIIKAMPKCVVSKEKNSKQKWISTLKLKKKMRSEKFVNILENI